MPLDAEQPVVPLDAERPFGERLDDLRRRESLTFRALAARLTEHLEPGSRPVSHSYLVNLVSGHRRPTSAVIKLVCRAFDEVEPDSFVEWRLWQMQRLLDPDGPGGLEAAVAEMRAFETGRRRGSPLPDGPVVRRRSRHVHAT